MKTYQIKTFYFSELSEEAKQNAYIQDRDHIDAEYYNADFRATLKAFEKVFNISVYPWSVDSRSYRFDFAPMVYSDADQINDPLRLAAFVWNNYAKHIQKAKLYSTVGRYENGRYVFKNRRSKIFKSWDNCPLTGCFCDADILQPVIDCLTYKTKYETFDDLITDCLNRFFETWRDCLKYSESYEFYEGEAEANEWEYYEDGTKFTQQRLVKA
jgi:hypothetical protein